MEQDTNKLISDQLKSLPLYLQRAITLTSWRDLVKSVAVSNNLDVEKTKNLETEAMLVIYGFESEDDLPTNIARELTLETGPAKMIAQNVYDKVFAPVLAKAEEIKGSTDGDTLKSIPENTPETQEIAPRVVVEPVKPFDSAQGKPPINLISPMPEQPKLEPPKPGASLASFSPTFPMAPMTKPQGPSDQRVLETPRVLPKSYPGGVDPYREQV